MVRHISAHEAQQHFDDLADRVTGTGEPVIVEREGHASVAVISLDDLAVLERLKARRYDGEFVRLAAAAAREHPLPEMTEEDLAHDLKPARNALHREWYGER
ncbi:MAG: type II toxin-antitoxin system Phd/YefM family antitoxin [Chloroflexi bacterium]|nr:type II toxin-antitoxin system Phd/YefM family antitoxin [Chloroflexota bacterium]